MRRFMQSIRRIRHPDSPYKTSLIVFAIENNLANEADWVYHYLVQKTVQGELRGTKFLCDPTKAGQVGILTTNARKIEMTRAMETMFYFQGLQIDSRFFTTEPHHSPEGVLYELQNQFCAWAKIETTKNAKSHGEPRFTYNGKESGPDDLCMAVLFGNYCYQNYAGHNFSCRNIG